MASEWARRKVEQIVKLAECIHDDDCEGPYGEEPCDCWVDEVRQEIAAALDEARARDLGQQHLDRAEKAERERDSYRRDFDAAAHACDKLQADLDAALLVIEDLCPAERWLLLRADKDGRILALLEKRRERG